MFVDDVIESQEFVGTDDFSFFMWFPPESILSDDYVRTAYLRFALFASDGEAADLLLSFPSVTDAEGGGTLPFAEDNGFDLRWLSGFDGHVQLMTERALRTAGDRDRRLQHEMVFRMPETYRGIRNSLITAVYHEQAAAGDLGVDRSMGIGRHR